ncbi:MAG: hypothetical protein ACLTDF_09955 [Coprococcus sp.]
MIIAKKILKITCIVLGVILAAAIIFVGVLTITEYKPDDSESLEVTSGSTFGKNTTGSAKLSPSVGDSISIVTWNLSWIPRRCDFSWTEETVCTLPQPSR